jgi:hypothetical protein
VRRGGEGGSFVVSIGRKILWVKATLKCSQGEKDFRRMNYG